MPHQYVHTGNNKYIKEQTPSHLQLQRMLLPQCCFGSTARYWGSRRISNLCHSPEGQNPFQLSMNKRSGELIKSWGCKVTQKKETHSHHGYYLGNLHNAAELSKLWTRVLDYQYLSRILLHYRHCSYKPHVYKYFLHA